jgi:predicted transcriptional regulator
MSLTITLPEPVATRLQHHAAIMHWTADEAATAILANALPSEEWFHATTETAEADADDSLLRLTERIRALPPNPRNVWSEEEIKAKMEGLKNYLETSIASEDPNEPFDEVEWNRQWDAVEAEMKARDRANAMAERLL